MAKRCYVAYEICGSVSSGLLIRLLKYIQGQEFKHRWDRKLIKGEKSRNFLKLTHNTVGDVLFKPEEPSFHGIFLEVQCKENLDLFDTNSGSDHILQIPDNLAEKNKWTAMFFPSSKLLIMQRNGRDYERKLEIFLNFHREKWNQNNDYERIDPVSIKAIPRPLPEQWLRSFPNLRGISFELDSNELSKTTGIVGDLLAPMYGCMGKYIVEMKVSTIYKGANLPSLTLSSFADIIDQVGGLNSFRRAGVKSSDSDFFQDIIRPYYFTEVDLNEGVNEFAEMASFACELIENGKVPKR